MAFLSGISSKASQLLVGEKAPKKRGILPTVASGVGVDITLRAIDKLVGSPMQRFAGFNVPFLGNVGIIDAMNFLIFSAGGRNIKGGVIAVAGAKLIVGGLPSIGALTGSIGSVTSGTASSVAQGTSGAPQ